MHLRFRLLVLLLLLALAARADAQDLDSRGKDFWITFMPNLGSGPSNVPSLRLYASSRIATQLTVISTETGAFQTISLPQPNQTVVININMLFGDFMELPDVDPFDPTTQITPRSFHVIADAEITLYGVNILPKSADAFLCLPEDVLTRRSIVLAYPNGLLDPAGIGSSVFDTPSQFAVIATVDSTLLTITPPTGCTINGHMATYTETLQKGEVYLGQAELGVLQDVSGTQINATRPIAVFGGHKRTSIPTRVGNYRDHLVEQLPPLEAWGREAIVTPHYVISHGSGDTAVFKVLAAFNSTQVSVTNSKGTVSYILRSGQSIEVPLLEPYAINATRPILVAQYEHSVGFTNSSEDTLGDPFMMLAPPTEQYDTAYAFQSIDDPEFSSDAHFINVVVPASAAASMRLDGMPIGAPFLPIPSTRYVYAQVHVSPGSHEIRADSGFGLFVYGYGGANSYGYPGGMLYRHLVRDDEPPELLAVLDTCGTIFGYAADARINDAGLEAVSVGPDTNNVSVLIDPIIRGSDTVHFRGRLLDPFQDGRVSISVLDSFGQGRSVSLPIAGFTLRVAGPGGAVPTAIDTILAINAPTFCRTIPVVNYGAFPQVLNRVVPLDSIPGWSLGTQLPITIQPGDTGLVDICFTGLPDTVMAFDIRIAGACAGRTAAQVVVDNRIDTTGPGMHRLGPPCGDELLLTYVKPGRASGIASVDVELQENCTLDLLTDLSGRPAEATVRMRRGDPRKQMIYRVVVRDGIGNSLIDADTVAGFTVAAMARTGGDTLQLEDGGLPWTGRTITAGTQECDSVMILNTGARALVIARARLRGNVRFSLPPSQFPVIVPPYSRAALAICTDGNFVGILDDTLDLFDDCEHTLPLATTLAVEAATMQGQDGCGVLIGLDAWGAAKRSFLSTPYPNPAQEQVTINLGLHDPARIVMTIVDERGATIATVLPEQQLVAGVHRVGIRLENIPSGRYHLRTVTSRGEIMTAPLVVHE